jgi:hypothetical protein
MSIATGTASGYTDLLDKLATFLTGAPGWTQLAVNTTSYGYNGDTVDKEYFFKAPGLSGSEVIYLNVQAFHNTSAGYYNWRLAGALGYNASQPFAAQPGVSPFGFMPAWTGSIPYTFIANGQRVIVIAQVGTVFESCYLGKFNPYGSPSQYPYPVAIGGSAAAANTLYSDTSYNHQAFFDPLQLNICMPDNSWTYARNNDTGGSGQNAITVWPWRYGSQNTQQPTWLQANLDGSYPLFAARIEERQPQGYGVTATPNLLGELDGVFFTSGVGLSQGSTITVGSATYLALQNIFRTAANNFAAILEA